jgi:hypothetical protein
MTATGGSIKRRITTQSGLGRVRTYLKNNKIKRAEGMTEVVDTCLASAKP